MDSKGKIIEIIKESIVDTGLETEVLPTSELTKLGIDSLMFIRIIVRLEEEFKIEFPDELLLLSEMNTVDRIYEVVTNLQRK